MWLFRETKPCILHSDYRNEEAAQYLTTLKAYEHKSADSLKEKVHQTYRSQLEHALTSGRKVNKSNAEAIAAQFGVRTCGIFEADRNSRLQTLPDRATTL